MLTHQELLKQLKQQVKESGSQKVLAHRLGVSRQYLNDILKGRRMPGQKVLRALGLELVYCYKQVRQAKPAEVTTTTITFPRALESNKREGIAQMSEHVQVGREEEVENI